VLTLYQLTVPDSGPTSYSVMGRKMLYLLCWTVVITQVVSQDSTGLGAEFQPSVKASCVGSTMTIRVDTALPFEGIVHSMVDREVAGCSELGRGGLKTFLKLDLSRPEGSNCGVQFNAETQERSVAIAVRAHQTVDLLEDRVYKLVCGKAGFQNSRTDVSVVQLKVTDGYQELSAALEDESYNLRAQVMNHDPSLGLLVRSCLVFDLAGTSVQLVDDRGCRNEKLISAWTYDDSAGRADATIYSFFRMPSSNRTYFQCDVEFCQGSCQQPDCQAQSASPEQGTADTASQQAQAVDSVTSSTSVFVADAASSGPVGVATCSAGDVNPTWLKFLTIAFGVLFAIMLLINVFLCSAMTCSCTRTEVIEKEPSIYDDYSAYEPQYGYANKTYSDPESEYGSQYGEEQLRDAPVSEVGTYRSEGGQGQGTLPRSRQGAQGYLE